ncbi:DEAD/DEAH box helicase family protein [Brevibacterium spongiae]|uniref:DEAD/DEAH box helicase family protein n=1 Tax=Brevibacterium spongiae TaxID=2909672 RepID=A0ABY5SRI1_9MICO|nr:DEAD/DEAH box helicase family protein [Brevibacterium spongiae]UVI35731.1 DEAD/DEAH box helicase family protein [Brevibacterium spongiae]
MTADRPPLRRHQGEALTALREGTAADERRSWIVLPPGAGKTRVGIEYATHLLDRNLVERIVVFGPNTAIQGQWAREWNRCGGDLGPAGTRRDLSQVFTALTYQSLAVFDTDRETVDSDDAHDAGRNVASDDRVTETGESAQAGSLLDALAPGGRELVDTLVAGGPTLLILDECHHLLEVWGRLLADLLTLLPDVWVLGLTATPPSTMSTRQRELVSDLFSAVRYSASIPALVKEGDLVPFADLVWVTEPTREEVGWLSAQAERHTEFITGILDPNHGTIGLLEWVDRRFLGDRAEAVSWQTMSRQRPELCDAALRLHHAGLLRLPPGARLGEQHRRDPDVDDWARLIEDWMRHHLLVSEAASDHDLAEAIRRRLPAIGCRWTRHGIAAGRSPIDRVLSHSASKPRACVDIVSAEAATLGDHLRMLVLCDFESATATLSADVRTVLDERSGSALLVLETLLADAGTAPLNPLLVSGRTVAGPPSVLAELWEHIATEDEELAARLHITDPESGVSRLEGSWTSREWVPHVTAFFASGTAQVLIGTRALLGEGWDAPAVTGLIDLTSATTPTAVTQTRGRALREDPNWADKVAVNWTVVCISAGHPRGAQDWGRLVRKHDGFFGTDADGEIVDGVAHIDPAFSAFQPPADVADAINARMTLRSQSRAEVARRWNVGADYRDEEIRSVRIVAADSDPAEIDSDPAVAGSDRAEVASSRGGGDSDSNRAGGAADSDGIVPMPRHRDGDPGRILPFTLRAPVVIVWATVGLLMLVVAMLSTSAAAWICGLIAAGLLLGLPVLLSVAGRRRQSVYGTTPTVAQIAGAIAEALHTLGLSSAGADAVRMTIDAHGDLRCHLDADPASAEAFALALDEAVSPIGDPRYLLPCWRLLTRADGLRGWWTQMRWGIGAAQEADPIWVGVPTVLGTKKERAVAFARAWDIWIGGGDPVYTRNPDGAGILAAVRGGNPWRLTSVLRTRWR